MEGAKIGWHFWPYKKMKDARGVVTFVRPAAYDSIIHYAETARKNFADIRKYRPQDMAAIKKALQDFLIQCRFENCTPNSGYIKALGFSDAKEANQTSGSQGNTSTSK